MARVKEHGLGAVDGVCTLCGNTATAFWSGTTGTIQVCFLCAADVLPTLIADAIPHLNCASLHSTAQRIERRFNKALASRAIQELEEARNAEPTHISDNLREILKQHGMN